MKSLVAGALVLSLFVVPLTSHALGLIGIGPRVGYLKSQDADQGSWLYGGALRLKLGGLGIEGSVDYRSEEFLDGDLKSESYPVMASLLIYPVPFVYGLAGMGWYNTKFDFDDKKVGINFPKDKEEQQVGWHFGGGLEIPMGKVTTLAADIRYVFLDYDFAKVPGKSELKSDFYEITLSIFWGF